MPVRIDWKYESNCVLVDTLIAAGYSTGEIGTALGVSRNAIVGRATRTIKHLSGRDKPREEVTHFMDQRGLGHRLLLTDGTWSNDNSQQVEIRGHHKESDESIAPTPAPEGAQPEKEGEAMLTSCNPDLGADTQSTPEEPTPVTKPTRVRKSRKKIVAEAPPSEVLAVTELDILSPEELPPPEVKAVPVELPVKPQPEVKPSRLKRELRHISEVDLPPDEELTDEERDLISPTFVPMHSTDPTPHFGWGENEKVKASLRKKWPHLVNFVERRDNQCSFPLWGDSEWRGDKSKTPDAAGRYVCGAPMDPIESFCESCRKRMNPPSMSTRRSGQAVYRISTRNY